MSEKPYRVLMLAADGWHDYDYLKQEFRRLASIHRHIVLVFPDDHEQWNLEVADYCRKNEQFTAAGFAPHIGGHLTLAESRLERDWAMFLDDDLDLMWVIMNSKGFVRRPSYAVYPHLIDAAYAMGVPVQRQRLWHK